MMKYLYIVLDGAGDKTYLQLNNQSPLGYARTKSLDYLASKSKLGLVNVVGKGLAPESDSAVMSLLGYDVSKEYPGRGVIEAIGSGMNIKKDTLYFRANFAAINNNWDLTDPRAGRINSKQAKILVREVNKIKIKGAKFKLTQTVGHRAILTVSAKGLSDNVTGNNNYYKEVKNSKLYEAVKGIKLPVKLESFKARDKTLEAKNTAMLLNVYTRMVYETLKNHPLNKRLDIPANMLLLRGAGNKSVKLESMKEKTGLKWAGLVEMPVEEGICKLSKMKPIFVGKETDTLLAKTKSYLSAVLKNIKKFDVLYIHIKGPDIPGHDGKLLEKVNVLEIIDAEFFTPLIEHLDMEDTKIIVTADHSTECEARAHTAKPTPLLFYKPGIESDGLIRFNETLCEKGSIGTILGREIIKLLK